MARKTMGYAVVQRPGGHYVVKRVYDYNSNAVLDIDVAGPMREQDAERRAAEITLRENGEEERRRLRKIETDRLYREASRPARKPRKTPQACVDQLGKFINGANG